VSLIIIGVVLVVVVVMTWLRSSRSKL